MLENIPAEIFKKITSQLSQEDKISLTYVSRNVYNLTIPSLYGMIYLNDLCYFPSDYDNSMGTHIWSVLYFRYMKGSDSDTDEQEYPARHKFKCLVRTLENSPERLCPLIQSVRCSWHLDQETIARFINLVNKYAVNLVNFGGYVRKEISQRLLGHADVLQSATISPPDVWPQREPAPQEYYDSIRSMISKYNFDNVRKLNIHINPRMFSQIFDKPLQIESLCLNLRPDTVLGEPDNRIEPYIPLHKVFDVNTLKVLEIYSWYDSWYSGINLYSTWGLYDFLEFKFIEKLSLLSLFADSDFLKACVTHFNHLKRLKVDFMYDDPVTKSFLDAMAMAPCSKTLEYIDIKVDEFDQPLLLIDDDDDDESRFATNVVCQCENCQYTNNHIINKKYFPNPDAFVIKTSKDEQAHDFVLQMFKLYNIIPHSTGFDKYPSVGYDCMSLTEHVANVNKLLGYKETSTNKVTEEDVVKLYHCFIHTLRRGFNYFINRFPNLEYLVFNDLPTKIIQYDEHQRCNIPLFYCHEYQSNQVYEIAHGETLFD